MKRREEKDLTEWQITPREFIDHYYRYDDTEMHQWFEEHQGCFYAQIGNDITEEVIAAGAWTTLTFEDMRDFIEFKFRFYK